MTDLHKVSYQSLITRLPYAKEYDSAVIIQQSKDVDERGLISISIPIHLESPNNAGRLISKLEEAGLILVSLIIWNRDRHIVASKSKRLTNTYEPIAIFSKSKNYILSRDSAAKIKKGFESRDTAFDEDEYLTCIGDHWPIRNDRRDRRFLPETIVLNLAQLADIQSDHKILDPYGNPGVKDACKHFGWTYVDGGLPSDARDAKSAGNDDDDNKEDNT